MCGPARVVDPEKAGDVQSCERVRQRVLARRGPAS